MNTGKTESGSYAKWLVTLGFLVLVAFGLRTISNSDFWLRLSLGRWIAGHGVPRTEVLSFTAAGTAWIDTSWFYDRLLFLVWSLGKAPAVILVHVAAVVGAFLCLLPLARKWAGSISIGLALLLSAWLIAPRFVVMPDTFALLFVGLFLLILSSPMKAAFRASLLIPLQILWTNIHPTFVLGPIIGAVFAVEASLQELSKRGDDSAAGEKASFGFIALVGGLLVATLLNPYGFSLHAAVIRAAFGSSVNFVQEWISPFSGQFSASLLAKHVVTLALVVGAGGLIAERRRLPIALTTLAVLGAFLVVRSLRFLELFAFIAFPFFALSFSAIGDFVKSRAATVLREKAYVLPALMAVLTAVLGVTSLGSILTNDYYHSSGSVSSFGLGAEYELFPSAAGAIIGRADFPQKAINLIGDGGFLAWQYPERSVFVDQRAAVYGSELLKVLGQALNGNDEGIAALEERWQPGAVIVNCCVPGAGAMIRGLLKKQHWALVYFDGSTAILARAILENQGLIRDTKVQDAGLQVLDKERRRFIEQLNAGKPFISPRLIGAGNFFLALGRYKECVDVYTLLTKANPQMANAWMCLGAAQAETGDYAAAAESMERATAMAPKNVWAWLYLSRAYEKLGRGDESRVAFEKGSQLNDTAAQLFKNGSAGKSPSGESPAPDVSPKP